MRVRNSVGLAVLVGVWAGIMASVARADDAPKLRYGFQADREYPYQIEIHAKIVDNKIDRQGELVYKVLSANEDQAVLKTSGSAAWQLGQLGMMRFPRMGPPFMHRAPEGTTVSRRGAVLVSGELTHLPMLLGDLETLVIDEFPDEAAATWEKQRDLVIQELESGGRFGPRFGPPIPLLPGSTATAQHTAKEVITYTVAETSDDLVRIGKKYSLKGGDKDKPGRFEMTGSGEIEFDRKEGVTKKTSMTYEVKINESGLTVTIPITVAARLFGESEWAEFKRKQEEAAKAAADAAAEAARPKPFKPGERDALVEQLTSSDDGKLIAAADRLSKAIRDDHPDDFARPLALLLSNSNAWVQAAAARALVIWATAESEDALVKLVKVDNFMYCPPAIQALATLKTERAARAVASQMPRYRGEAGKALKDMGPVAETAAISLLKNNDFWMRRETVGVLAQIGGEDAVQALQELATGLSDYDSGDMRQAINTIQRRLASQPKGAHATPRHAAKKPAENRAKKAAETPAAADQEMRTWHDATGKFEIEATLVSVKDQTVTLKKKNGRTIRVSLKKLSAEDQKYVQEQSQAAFGEAGADE
jgi:hypothetical protein